MKVPGLERIEEELARWEETTLAVTLKRRPERKPAFKTASGIPVKRLYTPLDVADLDYTRDLGFPGEFPFTRGVYATMYRGRIWTMRQYAATARPRRRTSASDTCLSRARRA